MMPNEKVFGEAYLLYYILPNGNVAVIGAYNTRADAERADPMARSVKPKLREEGVRGPFIIMIEYDDFCMSKDNFLEIDVH